MSTRHDMTENWQQKPAGQPQRPTLKATMGPALIELALKVTTADSAELRKAARYVLELGQYVQTEHFDQTRKKRNASVRSSKKKLLTNLENRNGNDQPDPGESN